MTVKPLGWWEDYLAWWAEQTEKAKNLKDKEAEQIRENASATGDPERIAAANAYIGNLDAIAKLNGCTSISSCNTAEMNDLREIWRNTQGLPPAEQLNLQNRIAFNIYEFAISPNRCNNCRNAVTAVLDNLSRSTKIGRKNGYKTADDMWGDSKGLNLTDAQNNAMKGIQKSILNGSMTAAKWKDRLQGDGFARLLSGLEGGWEMFAKFALMGLSDEVWYSIQGLVLAGLGATLVSLSGAFLAAGGSILLGAFLTGFGAMVRDWGLHQTIAFFGAQAASIACGSSTANTAKNNSGMAAIAASRVTASTLTQSAQYMSGLPRQMQTFRNLMSSIPNTPQIGVVTALFDFGFGVAGNIAQNGC